MKAAAIVLAVLLLLSADHAAVRLAGYPVAIPVPVLVLAAELGACAVLGALIWRARPFRLYPRWRTS